MWLEGGGSVGESAPLGRGGGKCDFPNKFGASDVPLLNFPRSREAAR